MSSETAEGCKKVAQRYTYIPRQHRDVELYFGAISIVYSPKSVTYDIQYFVQSICSKSLFKNLSKWVSVSFRKLREILVNMCSKFSSRVVFTLDFRFAREPFRAAD